MKKRNSIQMVLFALILFLTTCISPSGLKAESLKDTTFIVKFNSNGGNHISSIVNVLYGTTIDLPANPVRAGYWFRGWYKNASLSTKFDSSEEIRKNTTLYARWEKQSSTPYIMHQNISDGVYKSTVTIDLTDQNYGNACQMQLMTYNRSFIKDIVYTQNRTSRYIGFELNIADMTFDKTLPLPVRVKIPSSFSRKSVQIIYTTNRKTVSGIPQGYVNSNNEYVFDAYYSGTYILMESVNKTTVISDSSPKLSITGSTKLLKVNRQHGFNYLLKNYTGDERQLDFYWYSSKPYIASISKDGVLTAHRPGRTIISCVSTNSKFVATRTITIYNKLVKSIKTNVSTKKLKKGKTFNIRYSVSPSNASVKTVTYSTSNKKIATVTKSGKVKAIKKGTCYVKVATIDGSGKYKKIKVIVY